MSYRNFLDELRKGLPAKIYLLNSSDRFLHTEAASEIRNLVPDTEADFNYQSFDIASSDQDKASIDQILDVLNTIPFFGGRKYVLVQNAQKMAKKDLQRFGKYLENPSSYAVLVLLHEGSLKKEAKDIYKGVRQISLDIRESDLPSWIVSKAKQRGLNLSPETAGYMLAVIGPDLGMLSTEVEKLTLVGRQDIKKEDIEEIIEGKRTFGAFDLVNAIRDGNIEKVFRIFSVLRETEEPYALLGALNWQYSQMQGSGNSPNQNRYLYDVFRLLHEADIGIKTGGFYPFELMLVKLLRLKRQS